MAFTARAAARAVTEICALVGLVWLAGCEGSYYARRGTLFPLEEVTLFDEIADTILPATKTPGAKAAGVGSFIATMVTDTYDPGEQRIFRDGIETLERESMVQNGGGFMAGALSSVFTVWMGAGAMPDALNILLTLVD